MQNDFIRLAYKFISQQNNVFKMYATPERNIDIVIKILR